MTEPSAAVPALSRALAVTRVAAGQPGVDPDVAFTLNVKARQMQDAITAALGIAFTAVAQPAGTPKPSGAFAVFAGPVVMSPLVPGQSFEVRTLFTNRSPIAVGRVRVKLIGPGNWGVVGGAPEGAAPSNEPVTAKFTATVPRDAAYTRPYFTRASIQDARYTVGDPSQLHRPAAEAALVAIATYEVAGVPVDVRVPVTRLEPHPPYGYETRELAIVPALAVTLNPAQLVVPLGLADKKIQVRTEVTSNVDGPSVGTLRLQLPSGWTADPPSQPFQFSRAGERAFYPFTVTIPSLGSLDYRIEAVASSGGRDYREGYDIIQHRDLETRYLYRDAAAAVRGIDVKIAPGLKVGYVMGVGDEVPAGLAQLGVRVQLLGPQELASADLSLFDAIMTGTRAYGVREDLKTYNGRLLEYARNGGNLIVLYNTPEFVPGQYAPFPAELPRNAEEVSEENSPVDILAPSDPVFTTPNRITKADFDHWVEQRGSKFWSRWDAAYTPMIATWDQGQSPQRGGWLHAKIGKGHYTYFAYAFHRQLPYGVPGAYRLLANLLSLNQAPAR